MQPRLRPLVWAVAVSLLLHALVLGGTRWKLASPGQSARATWLEARLEPLKPTVRAKPAAIPTPVSPPPASPPSDSAGSRGAQAATPPPSLPGDAAAAEVDSASAPDAHAPPMTPQSPPRTPATPLEPAPESAPEPEPEPAPAPARTVEPPPALAAAPALTPLPDRLDLRYRVHYGLAAGTQTIVWIREHGARYTVTSVARATGLAGLFYRGQFVQTSRGRITERGLEPEEFWDQRGDKRSSAQFDAATRTVTFVPASGSPRHYAYRGDVQDVASLFIQLALVAPPPHGELAYTVFNGKKLREYRYTVRGEVALDTALGPVRTLRLARIPEDEGRFEIWLAIDHFYLPVRVQSSDDKGNDIALEIETLVKS